MKICLINPFFVKKVTSKYAMESNSHIGLGYIASALLSDGHTVNLIDCPILNVDIKFLYNEISNGSYDAVGMTASYENYVNVLRIARFIKKLNDKIFVFIGGYVPTLQYQALIKDFNYIDCMVIGEGEITAQNIFRNFHDRKWQDVAGIAYIQNDQVVFTGKTMSSNDLDDFSFPLRVDQTCKMARIVISRGCRGNCIFCSLKSFSFSMKSRRVRKRSPMNVIEEIEEIMENNHNVELIYLSDDNFSLRGVNDKKWFDDFFNLVQSRKLEVKFACEIRADDVIHSNDYLSKFKSIGLSSVFVGVESLLDSQLEFYGKNNSGKVNLEALMKLDALNIPYNVGFMLFNPIITIEDILETVRIIKRTKFNEKNKNIMRPISYSAVVSFDGTRLADFVEKNDIVEKSSSLQYRFMNKKAAFCYQVILSWKKCINDYFDEDIDIFYFYIKPNPHKDEIKGIFYRVFHVDLYVLESIALRIHENDCYDELDYSDILENGTKMLKELSDEYSRI